MEQKIKQLVDEASTIVVVQADNPDADSLGSALALEQILSGQDKDVMLYCGVDMPGYLHYLVGWDRVQKDLPKQFDLAVVVDANTFTLLGQLDKTGQLAWLKAKPTIVLDHHTTVDKTLDFAAVSLSDAGYASTGELIFELANNLSWPVNRSAAELLMSTILGDTQGLINDQTTARTYRVMAELTDLGAHRPQLEELRREYMRMPESIFRYKGRLIERLELAADNRIAYVTIPQDEINEYSPLYNPAVLVQFDSLQIESVQLSVVFKTYDDGRVTGKLRSNYSAPVADKLAEHFGGGGHPHSAGFKVTDSRPFNEIKSECLSYATELLNQLEQEQTNEDL